MKFMTRRIYAAVWELLLPARHRHRFCDGHRIYFSRAVGTHANSAERTEIMAERRENRGHVQ